MSFSRSVNAQRNRWELNKKRERRSWNRKLLSATGFEFTIGVITLQRNSPRLVGGSSWTLAQNFFHIQNWIPSAFLETGIVMLERSNKQTGTKVLNTVFCSSRLVWCRPSNHILSSRLRVSDYTNLCCRNCLHVFEPEMFVSVYRLNGLGFSQLFVLLSLNPFSTE